MKRLFYALLLAAGTTFSLGSCMNGDYDANPATDLSKIPNPSYDPGDGSVARGTIRCKVNGQVQTFTGALYVETSGLRLLAGTYQSNGGQKATTLSFNILSYGGAKTYKLDGSEATAMQTTAELSNPQNATVYATVNSMQTGTGELKVTDDSNNEMKGEFSFTAYQTLPSESKTEKIEVTEGKFYIPKQ